MRNVLGIVVGSCLLCGVAAAEPHYSQPLDTYTLDRAKVELRDLAKREGIEGETAEILLKLDVFATSNDTGCPGVDVDIINATNHTVWNIEAKIEQKEGSQDRTDKVHLPYMTANSKVRINVSCLQDYSYRSSYDYTGGGGISLTYQAEGAKSIDEALPKMLEQQTDYTAIGSTVSPTTVENGNLLTAALAMDDAAVAKELVQAIARTGVGRKELGEALANTENTSLADAAIGSLSKLPPAQQLEIARTLLASEAALRWKDKLNPMIDGKLCTGNRADVVGLWIQAQSPDGIPVEEFRTKITAKCKPTKADGPAIAAALEKDPKSAGGVLDAVDDDLFAGAVAAWSKAKKTSESWSAFLQDTQRPDRFDAAAKLVTEDTQEMAILAVIATPEGAGAAHKAEWLTAQFAKVAEAGIDTPRLVTEVTKEMVSGGVAAGPMRDAIKGLAKLAPKAAEDVMVAQASSHSRVFDAEKLQAAGLDMGEFLAFNATLPDCTATLALLEECADKIAAYKDPKLKAQIKDAVKPDFLSSVRELTSKETNPTELIPVAGALAKAGFDTGFIAERACRDAEDAVRFGDKSPDSALELANQISPDAPCITAVKDTVKGKERKAMLMGILGVICLIAPLPIGFWFIKRRYKKLLADLPKETKEEVVSGAKLEDRLGPNGLGRQLEGAIADANRELAGTAAGRAIGAVDGSVINAASSTVRRAAKSADAATLLVRRPGQALYIVALPVRHPRPQIAQRYLGAPWPEHLAQIQRAAGMPVLALVVLCGPDAAEASLLVGYSDGQQVSDPEVLLDAKDARDRGANKLRSVMTLGKAA